MKSTKNSTTEDVGKVRLGGLAPSMSTADAGKVRQDDKTTKF